MAIYNGKCVYVVDLYDAQRPSEMYTIINIETGKIVLQLDILPTFQKGYLFNYKNGLLEDSVSKIKHLNRNEKGNMT